MQRAGKAGEMNKTGCIVNCYLAITAPLPQISQVTRFKLDMQITLHSDILHHTSAEVSIQVGRGNRHLTCILPSVILLQRIEGVVNTYADVIHAITSVLSTVKIEILTAYFIFTIWFCPLAELVWPARHLSQH